MISIRMVYLRVSFLSFKNKYVTNNVIKNIKNL